VTDSRPKHSRSTSRLLAPLAVVVMSLSACASGTSYMGIDLRPGQADRGIQLLAMQARQGDQEALLHLAAAYDFGLGVAPDRNRAIRLYQLAARSDPGSMYVWVPDGSAGGRVQRLDTGPPRAGSHTARQRLQQLQNEVRLRRTREPGP
jgi:hypothetical protein